MKDCCKETPSRGRGCGKAAEIGKISPAADCSAEKDRNSLFLLPDNSMGLGNLKNISLGILAALALFLSSSVSRATTVHLEFSGGAGLPLTVTIGSPITLTIQQSSDEIYFTFKGVGNIFATPGDGSGTTGYTTSNGDSGTFTAFDSGLNQGDTAAVDAFFYTEASTVSVDPGDTVTLLAGSFTTAFGISSTPPANGNYTIFVANLFGTDISSVPEPREYALAFAVLLGSLILLRRRGRAAVR
jgi:hypothetical protein